VNTAAALRSVVHDARSLLFVPANRPERCAKALAAGADLVCVDLEDAVPAAERSSARQALLPWLASLPAGHRAGVRINTLRSADALHDLIALQSVQGAPAFVMLAKAESAEQLRVLAAQLPGVPLLALVESARGMVHAPAMAQAAPELPSLAGLMFGGADYAADIGCAFAWEPLLHARSSLVAAAAIAGLACLDVPFLDLADSTGLAEETRRAAALGFTGKALIHPAQVQAVHAALRPAEAALAQAERVLAAAAQAAGGVARVDGRMVDRPVVLAAERTVRRAAA
jgi:(S)-citramalyl-CoA lyase